MFRLTPKADIKTAILAHVANVRKVLCGWFLHCKNFLKLGVSVRSSLVSGLLVRVKDRWP